MEIFVFSSVVEPWLSTGSTSSSSTDQHLTDRGEEKGSASNLTVGFTRDSMHQSARCTRPNSLYYILTVGPGDKVSILRSGGPW